MVGKGDAAAQIRQIFKNIGDVLKSVGAGFGNVVQFTTYLPGRELVEPFLEARTELADELYLDGDFLPCTLLIVAGLQSEELLAEVTTIAAI
jgi:enamine deaminase RidA (YjgF/YER057c/UK114 family)